MVYPIPNIAEIHWIFSGEQMDDQGVHYYNAGKKYEGLNHSDNKGERRRNCIWKAFMQIYIK